MRDLYLVVINNSTINSFVSNYVIIFADINFQLFHSSMLIDSDLLLMVHGENGQQSSLKVNLALVGVASR